MTTEDDRERLLSILHAHGQQFLSPAISNHGTNDLEFKLDSDGSEEEWPGFSSSANRATTQIPSEDKRDGGDDDFSASSSRTPDVMVFFQSGRRHSEASFSANEPRKSFMSSKVSNITLSPMQRASADKKSAEELNDQCTNAQNDAFLHRLVHTKLLSGSLNSELDLDHAQRGRALAGRVLELAGEAKLGKGEDVFRKEQRSKAAKRIREGLIRKQREREQKAVEEAKNMGNYHPALKRLYDSNSSSTSKKRRVRGLGMGIGKFVGGTLKLSREEIASVTGSRKRLGGDDCRGRRERPR